LLVRFVVTPPSLHVTSPRSHRGHTRVGHLECLGCHAKIQKCKLSLKLDDCALTFFSGACSVGVLNWTVRKDSALTLGFANSFSTALVLHCALN
jgi:hypothetical protein